MHFKTFKNIINIIITITIIIFNTSCSVLQNISKHYDFDQGNHLNEHDIQKIHIGMNKTIISHIIGYPTLQDLFGQNIWYYIYYYQHHNKIITQQTLILKFNVQDILIEIKNKNT